jgi:SAM-dependent methyltransferase
MEVFNDYAEFYDLFYGEKDYQGECRYVIELARKHSERPVKSLLDIGCGTGGHALLWAKDGIEVSGLDRSPEMLVYAREKAKRTGCSVSFHEGDIRGFDMKRKFDLAVAMFAVLSYQNSTEDVLSALLSVRRHLDTGGLFLFDAWSGPGVLSDPPLERVGSFVKGDVEIIRTVKPEHDVSNHVVNVNYDILCIKGDRVIKRIKEIHPMRYFFPQEMADLASRCEFEVIAVEPFMRPDEGLRVDDWNAMFALRAM